MKRKWGSPGLGSESIFKPIIWNTCGSVVVPEMSKINKYSMKAQHIYKFRVAEHVLNSFLYQFQKEKGKL